MTPQFAHNGSTIILLYAKIWYMFPVMCNISGVSMSNDPIKSHICMVLSRELLLDLEDRVRAEALKAFEMIRDHSGLNGRRARGAEGQARFRMMEQGFEDVCHLHGGHLLDGAIIPNTELQVFQPFMRFDSSNPAVILGLASMAETKTLPAKNMSREAGVTVNYELVPRLDLDDKGPKIGDIFVLLLVSRDRENPGKIEEVAVGVINSQYEHFLFYEPLDQFLSGDSAMPSIVPEPPSVTLPTTGVVLKRRPIPFLPPEVGTDEGDMASRK